MSERPENKRPPAKSLRIRSWHWSNAFLTINQAITGVSLHFADPKGNLVDFSLAADLHMIGGALLVALYVSFIVRNWRRFMPKVSTLVSRCKSQAHYYSWGIFKGESSPHSSPHALQALLYFLILFVLMPTVALTGLVFLFPEVAPSRAFGRDGLLPIALAHYVTATFIVALMMGHIYLGTMRKSVTSSFKSMITGRQYH
jgi:thiosulfate reductase cytochrome b subunit